ncbi:transposase, partial [Kibdelosporangium lantanae]
DRVMRFPTPARAPGTRGRPVRHGARFEFTNPTSWPTPAQSTTTDTIRYGVAHAQSWDRLHTKLTRVGAWAGHEDLLLIVEGTLI